MGSTLALNEYASATADSTGTATVTIGPHRYGDSWYITLISSEVQSTKQTTLTIYRGVPSNTSIIGGTYSGNFDSASGGAPIVVKDGDKLTFQWTNCNQGDVCQARLEGTFQSGRYGAG